MKKRPQTISWLLLSSMLLMSMATGRVQATDLPQADGIEVSQDLPITSPLNDQVDLDSSQEIHEKDTPAPAVAEGDPASLPVQSDLEAQASNEAPLQVEEDAVQATSSEVAETSLPEEKSVAGQASEEAAESSLEGTASAEQSTDAQTESVEAEDLAVIVELNSDTALDQADYADKEAFNAASQLAKTRIQAQIDLVKGLMKDRGFDLKVDYDYSTAFAGFSTRTSKQAVDILKTLKEVKAVTEQGAIQAPKQGTQMLNSSDQTGLDQLLPHGIDYQGENMVVSVIDTGVDPDHKDLVLEDSVEKRYDKETMEAKIKELNLPGQWLSNKIPYAYNYADRNQIVKDTNEHGLHVAGTIGANGDLENGGIKGVAPHVQLLVMKAFSNDQLTSVVYTDIYLKAIDDSIKLGADVINMSLGSMAGFSTDALSPLNQMFKKAREHGIVIAVAAGNDHNNSWIGNNYPDYPEYNNLDKNPDQGLVGSPASEENSLSVASFENNKLMSNYLDYKDSNQQENLMGTNPAEEIYHNDYHSIVLKDLGKEEEYAADEDLTGKYVLIQRGQSSFGEKYRIAIEKGAAGVVIYDNAEADFAMNMIGIDVQADKPVMFIRMKDGLKLKEAILNGMNPQVRIPKGQTSLPSPKAGDLSDFSSWGPTGNLSLKPEIAAPGGNIYSLMSDNRYQTMSGTSMATPHIAGLSALLLQHLYQEGILKRGDQGQPDPRAAEMLKLILMNTAVPKDNKAKADASYYGPSQQGAGMVNIYKAILNRVLVTAQNDHDQVADGKLEIGQVQDEFQAKLQVENTGKIDAEYTVEYILLASQVDGSGRYTETNALAQKSALGRISVAAGQKLDLNYTLSTFDVPNQQLVEGYFFFHSANEALYPSLSLPFLGFKGDWSAPHFVDEIHDFTKNPREESNFKPIDYPNGGTDKTAFVISNPKGGYDYWNAFKVDDKRYVFVNTWKQVNNGPNEVVPVISFLRNATDVHYLIKDQEGRVIRQLMIDNKVWKAGRIYQNQYAFLSKLDGAAWDLTNILGQKVAEGSYIYEINGVIDYPGAKRQVYQYEIIVDNTKPLVETQLDNDQLQVKMTDQGSGLTGVEIYHPGSDQWFGWIPIDRERKARTLHEEVTYHLDELLDDLWGEFELLVYDNSGNVTSLMINRGEDPNPPADQEEAPGQEEPNQPQEPDQPGQEEDKVDRNPVQLPGQQEGPYTDQAGVTTQELPKIKLINPNYYLANNKESGLIEFNGELMNFKEIHDLQVNLLDDQGRVVLANLPYELVKVHTQNASKDLDSTVFEFAGKADLHQTDKGVSGVVSGQYWLDVTVYTLSEKDHLVSHNIKRQFRLDGQRPIFKSIQQVASDRPGYVAFEIDYQENMNYLELWANNHLLERLDATFLTLEPWELKGKKTYYIPDQVIGTELNFKAYDDAQGNESIQTLLVQDLPLKEAEEEPQPQPEEPQVPGEESPSPAEEAGLQDAKAALKAKIRQDYDLTEAQIKELDQAIEAAKTNAELIDARIIPRAQAFEDSQAQTPEEPEVPGEESPSPSEEAGLQDAKAALKAKVRQDYDLTEAQIKELDQAIEAAKTNAELIDARIIPRAQAFEDSQAQTPKEPEVPGEEEPQPEEPQVPGEENPSPAEETGEAEENQPSCETKDEEEADLDQNHQSDREDSRKPALDGNKNQSSVSESQTSQTSKQVTHPSKAQASLVPLKANRTSFKKATGQAAKEAKKAKASDDVFDRLVAGLLKEARPQEKDNLLALLIARLCQIASNKPSKTGYWHWLWQLYYTYKQIELALLAWI
ncbi:S8 family serine peptidase [Facklamia hominis]|uniref:S8 family serine peptidase n=1 Tax=Facklamia hominis TaxID=178214 RepID=UPI00101CAF2F|nr:S8 family serine peptidase [Facklamia hominis]RYC98025.1 hypothetical protein EKN08_05210 [Facklamia hominis]